MANIFLFGVSGIVHCIPSNIVGWLESYLGQGHKFILGDKKGADTAFQKALSGIGAADSSTVYVMGEAHNNAYGFKTKAFKTKYNPDTKVVTILDADSKILSTISEVQKEDDIEVTREWYEFKDRQLIKDCDIAIGLYDGENKVVFRIVQLLNIMEKPCYLFNLQGGTFG